jgi:hypothetical protein
MCTCMESLYLRSCIYKFAQIKKVWLHEFSYKGILEKMTTRSTSLGRGTPKDSRKILFVFFLNCLQISTHVRSKLISLNFNMENKNWNGGQYGLTFGPALLAQPSDEMTLGPAHVRDTACVHAQEAVVGIDGPREEVWIESFSKSKRNMKTTQPMQSYKGQFTANLLKQEGKTTLSKTRHGKKHNKQIYKLQVWNAWMQRRGKETTGFFPWYR